MGLDRYCPLTLTHIKKEGLETWVSSRPVSARPDEVGSSGSSSGGSSSGGSSSDSGDSCGSGSGGSGGDGSGYDSDDGDSGAAISVGIKSYDVGAVITVVSLYVSCGSSEDSVDESSAIKSGDGEMMGA